MGMTKEQAIRQIKREYYQQFGDNGDPPIVTKSEVEALMRGSTKGPWPEKEQE